MAYIGNEPSVNFTSFAKQDLTGVTGSPAKRGYTLSHAVANANEIEVFVNNVRQEPTEAYTVNGTGLTMTGDVETTDDFYIIYLGKAIQTTVPPDGSVSTAKIASSAVDLTSKVTGVLPVANGGTGVSSNFSYAEGTWTPTNASSNHFHSTVNVTSANYTKIGRAVFLNFQINMASSSGNIGSDSYFSIGALPFTLNSVAGGTATVSTNLTTAGYVTGIITGFSGDTTVYVNFSGVISGSVPRSNHVTGQFNYFTNE